MSLNKKFQQWLVITIVFTGKILGLIPLLNEPNLESKFFFKIKHIWSNVALSVISISSFFMIYGSITVKYTFLYHDKIESILGFASAVCFYLTILSITYTCFRQKVKILYILEKVNILKRTDTKANTFKDSFTSSVLIQSLVKFFLNGIVIIFLPFLVAKSINDTFHSNTVILMMMYLQIFLLVTTYTFVITMYNISFHFVSHVIFHINCQLKDYLLTLTILQQKSELKPLDKFKQNIIKIRIKHFAKAYQDISIFANHLNRLFQRTILLSMLFVFCGCITTVTAFFTVIKAIYFGEKGLVVYRYVLLHSLFLLLGSTETNYTLSGTQKCLDQFDVTRKILCSLLCLEGKLNPIMKKLNNNVNIGSCNSIDY